MRKRQLRPGDLVEVRSAAEILTTLDEKAACGSMPFMPEMLRLAGHRFTVSRRVEKICDTPGYKAGVTPQSRRMRGTVYLDDVRCDGSAHGGCQAGCRLYWREEWLRRVDADSAVDHQPESASTELEALTEAATTTTRESDGRQAERYRCQATEAPAASEQMSRLDPLQYVREVTSGNVSLWHLTSVLARAVVSKLLRMLRLRRPRPIRTQPLPTADRETGEIRPGDVVQVRSFQEIERTLDEGGKNRGLWFDDSEMVNYCEGTYRVRDRVERFIDDRTGRMIEPSADCLILDGVICTGECSRWRWFCPRGIYSFWREEWLQRVDQESAPSLDP